MALLLKWWTREMESFLIDEVKKIRHLWDSNSRHFRSRELKKSAYEGIGLKMDERFPDHAGKFTVDALHARFSNLKTVYVRLKKNLSSRPKDDDYTPVWTHYDQMKFLDDTDNSYLDSSMESSKMDVSLQKILIEETYSLDEPEKEEPLTKDTPAPAVIHVRKHSSPKGPKKARLTRNCVVKSMDESEKEHLPVVKYKRKLSSSEGDLVKEDHPIPNNVVKPLMSAEEALGQYIALKLKCISDPAVKSAAEMDLVKTITKYA